MASKSERGITPIFKRIIRILLALFAILFQIMFYRLLFLDFERYSIVETTARILGIILVLHLYRSDSNQAYKLSWTIFILLIYFAGPLLYLTYGQGKSLPKRKFNKITKYMSDKMTVNKLENDLQGNDKKLINQLNEDTGFIPYKNTETTFFSDGKDKFDVLLEELRKAEKYIFIEYFIIADGYAFSKVKEILIEKAQMGVEIKIIYDDIGSRSVLKKRSVKKLNEIDNIEIVSYNPMGINFSLSLNYRDHRKIVIIDGCVAFVGGDNLADEYIHKKKRFGFWRDNALLIRGDAVYSFILLFTEMWYISTKKVINPINYASKIEVNSDGYVMPFGDGPTYEGRPAYNLFISLFNSAKKTIFISTPYFIIDNGFVDELVRQIKSGVDVRILLPKIPDKKTVFLMSKAHYGKILKAGGKIYEYTPGFNHAKNIIIDDNYAFIGTINIDYRSLFLHFECGNLLIDTSSIIEMKKDFLKAIEISEEISYVSWKKRSIFVKVFEYILYILSPLM